MATDMSADVRNGSVTIKYLQIQAGCVLPTPNKIKIFQSQCQDEGLVYLASVFSH